MNHYQASLFKKNSSYDLERLNVHTHNGCNLKCSGCNHHSQLFSPKATIDVKQLLLDLEIFLAKCKVLRVHVLGGEPLLNPSGTQQVLTFLLQKDVTVRLITNGLLLQKNIDWLAPLISQGVELNVSIHTELSSKQVMRFQERNPELPLKINDFRNEMWFSLIGPYQSNKEESFERCISLCPQLYRGKVYKCPHVAYVRDVFPSSDKRWDYMKAYQPLDIKGSFEEYQKFIQRQYTPEDICAGCPSQPKYKLHQQVSKDEYQQVISQVDYNCD